MDRKAQIRAYKETPRPAGVFVVLNKVSGRRLVGSSQDLPGMLNRQRFQLENGSHPDRELQRDWRELGPDAFEFGVLDELAPPKEPGGDLSADLRALQQLWLEKMAAANEPLYPMSRRGA